MYIIYPVIELPNKKKRLGVIYRNIRTFMRNRSVAFNNGYFVPDNIVKDCVAKLELYKQNWIAEGGEPDRFKVLQFELLCNDLPTYHYCRAAVRECCLARLEKTYRKIAEGDDFTDVRRLRGLILDREYIAPFAVMFPGLPDLTKVIETLPDDPEHGKRYLLEAMEQLRVEDKE